MFGLPDPTTASGLLEILVGWIIIRGIIIRWATKKIEGMMTLFFLKTKEEVLLYKHYKQQQINKQK